MKPIKFFTFIKVDEYSATPKYLQLTNSILTAIESGKIQKDDLLPSINELSYELEISRDTAEKGYKYLKKLIEGGENAHEVINLIPKEKLVLLDKKIPGVDGEYAAAYENFEKDIYVSLDQAREQLSKYHTIKLIFPKDSYFPKEIIKGFSRFCQQYAFTHKVINSLVEEELQEGVAYINLMENDLVVLIEKIISSNLKIGKQIGVISYNETPLKKIILNGITTISTDFKEMGTLAAQLILENSRRHAEVPFTLTLRKSL
ncbi:hypothetical protein EON73_00120 [bacterium]|nr:MAG: hypothetical protein EON73_00120 [bacterium]